MIICTSICTNYLPKAMALAESMKRFNPKMKFLLCLSEKSVPKEVKKCKWFDYVVLSKDLGFFNPDRYLIRYSIVEASTAVKGQLFRYMLGRFSKENKFVYLDPDILVYSELVELENLLKHYDIVLTPHLLHPGNLDMELSCMNHGIYNLGFLGIRRSAEAERFIDWWATRLDFACYDDMGNGIFTDQKWIDLAPALFNAYICKDPGYNVATWNLLERAIEKKNGKLFANKRPIRFIHFSGFDSNTFFWAVDQWVKENPELVRGLGEDYRKRLMVNQEERLRKTPWSYDFLDNGEKITPKIRKSFRNHEFLKQAEAYKLSIKEIEKHYTATEGKVRKVSRLIKKIRRKLNLRFLLPRFLQSRFLVNYNIDDFQESQDFVQIQGWAFIKWQHAIDSEIILILRPTTGKGKDLVFETSPQKRPDVTEYFELWDLDDSGFRITLDKRKIHSQVKNQKVMQVVLLVKNRSGSDLQVTDRYIEI